MHIGRILTVSLLAMVLSTAAWAAEQFVGTYSWSNKKDNEYGNKELELSLVKKGNVVQASFSAFFYFGNKVNTGKAYTYKGDLTGDLTGAGLTGKVYDSANKRFWNVSMQLKQGVLTGTAQETKGYKSSGTFTLKAQ